MKDEKIEWGEVVIFFVFILFGIWTVLVFSGHAPIFDFYQKYGVFHFDTFLEGIFASVLSFGAIFLILIAILLIIAAFFDSINETFKAGRYGINYVKEKIKRSRETKKGTKKTKDRGPNKKGMGNTEPNL